LRTAFAAALVAGAACATNPATGERQLSLVSERQEIELGRQGDAQVLATIGVVDDPALQSYVERVGERLAALSERPALPWSFRVADDAAVNAFALPGGFLYVTRGILAHLNSEAELAVVLGHEIGHVTARHAAQRLSQAQLANVGLGVGMILSPELRQFGDLANVGLSLLFLKYSRDDERQADDLGLRYLLRGGYDPRPATEVFTMLERVSRLDSAGRLPGWLSSHPDPEDRRERLAAQIAELGGDPSAGTVERDAYLRRLDGLVYGPNPREGFFRQGVFVHPDLRFQFRFPRDWPAVNQKQAVSAISPGEDAIVAITLARGASAEAAMQGFAGQGGVRTGRALRRDVNGLPAVWSAFEARTESGVLRGLAAFVEHGGRVFQLLAYAPAARWGAYENLAAGSLASFERLTDPALLAVRPATLDIVELPEALTIEQFAARYPSTISLERLALLNGVAAGERLPAGRLMKRVTGGGIPD
jgi:predicted Zn-dependent protease